MQAEGGLADRGIHHERPVELVQRFSKLPEVLRNDTHGPERPARDRPQLGGGHSTGLGKGGCQLPRSPVPGYRAPADRTEAPGTRVIYSLVGILDAAFRAGELKAPHAGAAVVPPALSADFEAIRTGLGLAVPDGVIANGLLVWTSLFGAVSFEVFGQYGPDTFSAREELFEHHLAVLAGIAGFGRS